MTTQAKEPCSEAQVLAVTEKQARAMLGGISGTTLWRLRKRGLIRAVPGLRILYSVEELRAFVAGKTGGLTAVLSPLPRTVNRKPAPSPMLERQGAN